MPVGHTNLQYGRVTVVDSRTNNIASAMTNQEALPKRNAVKSSYPIQSDQIPVHTESINTAHKTRLNKVSDFTTFLDSFILYLTDLPTSSCNEPKGHTFVQ